MARTAIPIAVSRLLWVAGSFALLGLAPVQAKDTYPQLSGAVLIEVENDWTYDSDDEDAELNDLYTTIEPEFTLALSPSFYFHTLLIIEPVLDPSPGKSRAFTDHGVYVDVLTVNYETDMFHLYAGKFTPHFSLAYDAAAGIYGTDLSEDVVELSERVGAGFSASFGEDGNIALSASVFTADTSDLSDSWATKRGRTREADGGLGNTGSLDNFVVALDMEGLSWSPGMHWHLGVSHQSIDEAFGGAIDSSLLDDETRAVIAVEWSTETAGGTTITPLLEWVHYWDTEGVRDVDADMMTASVAAEFGSWNVAAAFSQFDVELLKPIRQFQLSAGYAFESGITLDVGWKWTEEEDVESNILGVFATYTWEF